MRHGSRPPLPHPCSSTAPPDWGVVEFPNSNFSELSMHPLHKLAWETHPGPCSGSSPSCLCESTPDLPHPLSPCPSRFRQVPGLTHHVMTRVSCNWVWAQTIETWAYLDLNTWVGICSMRTSLERGEASHRATGTPVRPSGLLPCACRHLLATPPSPRREAPNSRGEGFSRRGSAFYLRRGCLPQMVLPTSHFRDKGVLESHMFGTTHCSPRRAEFHSLRQGGM